MGIKTIIKKVRDFLGPEIPGFLERKELRESGLGWRKVLVVKRVGNKKHDFCS
jgi:hypothetical protein